MIRLFTLNYTRVVYVINPSYFYANCNLLETSMIVDELLMMIAIFFLLHGFKENFLHNGSLFNDFLKISFYKMMLFAYVST